MSKTKNRFHKIVKLDWPVEGHWAKQVVLVARIFLSPRHRRPIALKESVNDMHVRLNTHNASSTNLKFHFSRKLPEPSVMSIAIRKLSHRQLH